LDCVCARPGMPSMKETSKTAMAMCVIIGSSCCGAAGPRPWR
jgi:hypothetical protein